MSDSSFLWVPLLQDTPRRETHLLSSRATLVLFSLASGSLSCFAISALRDHNSFRVLNDACDPELWIIRHAEKVDGGLSVLGNERAVFLRNLTNTGVFLPFIAVFATNPDTEAHMVREVQTAAPLATALGLRVDTRFARDEEAAMAIAALDAARKFCGPVLIVWEHCRIPAIAIALECTHSRCITCWDDGSYDDILRLRVARHGAPRAVLLPQPQSEGFPHDAGLRLGWSACIDPMRGCCTSKHGCAGTTQSSGWYCPCQLAGQWVNLSAAA